METNKEIIVRLYPDLFHLSDNGNMYFIDNDISNDPMDVSVDWASCEWHIQSIYPNEDRDNNLSMWINTRGGILSIMNPENIHSDTILCLIGYDIDLSYYDSNMFVKLDRQAILRKRIIQDIIE